MRNAWVVKLGKKNISGKRIRVARLLEKPRATQADISARLEVVGVILSPSSIGKIEQGQRPITDIQLTAISKVLKVSVTWLLGAE